MKLRHARVAELDSLRLGQGMVGVSVMVVVSRVRWRVPWVGDGLYAFAVNIEHRTLSTS